MATSWENRKEAFKVVDVREATGNFLPGLLRHAGMVEVGDGICVIQSFEPIPLYSAMADLGFERHTDTISDSEYRVYFCRTEKGKKSFSGGGDMPLKPTAVLNFKKIDNALAGVVVDFWNLIWGSEDAAIAPKTKLLLSLANGVGAGRYRQATRELVKAYALGVSVAELDELFAMFVWNGGIGTFASEIGPSPLFGAYQLIKQLEAKGLSREQVMSALAEQFGEKNPDVGMMDEGSKGT
jgi:hypothetical protein